MRYFLLCFTGLLLSACGEEAPLEWEAGEYHGKGCEGCPVVDIYIPEASERTRAGRVINRGVREEIIAWLDYDEQHEASDIPEAIDSFEKGFRLLQEEFPDEPLGWEANIEGVISYESPLLLSLKLEGYIFTGGAHGYGSTRYLNFSLAENEELEAWRLFSDVSGLEALAESAFRQVQGISAEEPINSTGFMFEDNRFSLPENIGLEPGALILHYNPYDIASYADGPVILKLPLEEARPFLNPQLFQDARF